MTRSLSATAVFVALAALGAPGAAHAQILDRPEGGQHVVVVGNTLWDLAQRFYGDPFQWPRIYEANTDRVDDPHWIYPGQRLRIPGADGSFIEVVVVSDEPETVTPAGGGAPRRPTTYREPERTKFWRDTLDAARRAREQREQWVAVPTSVFYSAPFLEEPDSALATGQILDFAGSEEIRWPRSTGRLYEQVVVRLDGPRPAPGTRLQAYHVDPVREDVGLVATPTGVLTVLGPTEGGVVASVDAQYERLQIGDLVRPLPRYPLARGVVPQPVASGPLADVLAYARVHELHQPGNFLFVGLGARDGLRVGDEFVVATGNPGSFDEGRVQIVGIQDEVATARIVMLRNPVFEEGIQLRLDRKMPTQ